MIVVGNWPLILFICLLPLCTGVDKENEPLPPCQACKVVVNSFREGMDKTNKKHFGGGDTAWEEEKLGEYAVSEVRLVEVQEQLCKEVARGQKQCYQLAEDWENHLEEWWFGQKTLGDLYEWLCVKKVEHCCPKDHYGPECKPCDGFPDNICSNNGKCKGGGTRKGNGGCACNEGYAGPQCDACGFGFYESYRDEKKSLCTKCHKACKGACRKAGADGCVECNPGWTFIEDHGCLDVNECAPQSPCPENKFCVNNEGSYSCLSCDESCQGCHGDGPDMCEKCADGYRLDGGLCVPTNQRQSPLDWTRYLTYLGLCVATCIIFQKNTVAASVIGILVAIYVSVSEYMLTTMPGQNQLLQDALNKMLRSKK